MFTAENHPIKTKALLSKHNDVVPSLSCGMIIRFHYEEDDPRFDWRFSYFKTVTLPRILNQSYDDFDICIRCNEWHKQLFEDLHPRIKTFHLENEFVGYKVVKQKQYFHDFLPWSQVRGLKKYDVQISVDSDDLIAQDFVALIMFHIIDQIKKGNKDRVIHVHFQPQLFNLRELKVEEMVDYRHDSASAFFGFYQPKGVENYKFVNAYSHLLMGKHADISIKLGVGHCWATAHYCNESTGK